MANIISVIIPIYKVEKYLDQCMESIVEQTYSTLDIILIDDGSTDGSAAACDSWAEKDSRIRVVHKKNGGLSSARNAGLDICIGDYITFVDSDDWVEPTYVSTQYWALIDNRAQVCSANMIEHYEDTGKTRPIVKKGFIAEPEETLMMLYNQNEFPVGAAPKMYSANIWNKMRFPEGRNYEDAYTTYLAVAAAQKIVHLSETVYHYRIRSGSIMTSVFSLGSLDRVKAWKENYLFCKDRFPNVAPYARMFWLEHIPALLSQFPQKMNEDEKTAKKWLKHEIWENMGFILLKMPLKKIYWQMKGLLL